MHTGARLAIGTLLRPCPRVHRGQLRRRTGGSERLPCRQKDLLTPTQIDPNLGHHQRVKPSPPRALRGASSALAYFAKVREARDNPNGSTRYW